MRPGVNANRTIGFALMLWILLSCSEVGGDSKIGGTAVPKVMRNSCPVCWIKKTLDAITGKSSAADQSTRTWNPAAGGVALMSHTSPFLVHHECHNRDSDPRHEELESRRSAVPPLSVFFWMTSAEPQIAVDCPPAMTAGVTDRLWDLADIVRLVDKWEAGRKEEQESA